MFLFVYVCLYQNWYSLIAFFVKKKFYAVALGAPGQEVKELFSWRTSPYPVRGFAIVRKVLGPIE